MPCPHRTGADGTDARRPLSTRRGALQLALAVGGSVGLSACLGVDGREEPSFPTGVDDPGSVPERQYAWNDYLPRDPSGNTSLPEFQTILLVEFPGDGPPADDDRRILARALDGLDRAVRRGTGGTYTASGPSVVDGLLYTVGYAPRYFDRFETTPAAVEDRLRSPGELIDRLGEDATADDAEAAVVLSSDDPALLLTVEEALRGERRDLNGERLPAGLGDVVDVVDRREGFVGPQQIDERVDNDDIPTPAPMQFGFRSGFIGNQARERRVAIRDGPFADGTVQMISRLDYDLDGWYDHPIDERAQLMYRPDQTTDDVGRVGELIAQETGVERSDTTPAALADSVREHGLVGHTQKTAAARDEAFESPLLRRSEGTRVDEGLNFSALQRTIDDFVRVRKAMDDPEIADGAPDLPADHSGIKHYLDTVSRGVYLVPPRSRAALPVPGG